MYIGCELLDPFPIPRNPCQTLLQGLKRKKARPLSAKECNPLWAQLITGCLPFLTTILKSQGLFFLLENHLLCIESKCVFSLLGPVGRPLPRDGLEPGLDGLHRAPRVARHALQEEQPRLLVQDGVGGTAGVARDVLLDVPVYEGFSSYTNIQTIDKWHLRILLVFGINLTHTWLRNV